MAPLQHVRNNETRTDRNSHGNAQLFEGAFLMLRVLISMVPNLHTKNLQLKILNDCNKIKN